MQVIDGWEDFVPKGSHTDFFRAVDAKPGEMIVCSPQVWSDKEQFCTAEAKMHEGEALEYTDESGEPPFYSGRLIFGCLYTLQ